MKFKTTQKAIKEGYSDIYAVNYCDACNILAPFEPVAYTAGIYGWNCDVYQFGQYAIATGYRTIGDVVPYELIKALNDDAKTFLELYGNGVITGDELQYNCRNLIYKITDAMNAKRQ